MSDTSNSATPIAFNKYEFPDALRPALPLSDPNEPIEVYQGRTQLTLGGKSVSADARIQLHFVPSLAVRFEISSSPETTVDAITLLKCGSNCELRLNDGTVIAHALTTGIDSSFHYQHGASSRLKGVINQRVVRPHDVVASYVLFLLPNFDAPFGLPLAYQDGSSRAARNILIGGGWKLTLDATDKAKEALESLQATGGFAATQVGRIEREDGKQFTAADSWPALNALRWYASFCCGRWTGPYLPIGFNEQNVIVWEAWDYCRAAPYRTRLSWMDACNKEHFEAPFPGFMKKWLDENWEEAIRVAIHWYVEANAQAGSIEGAIVLTQTAFELLSSVVLVENHAWLSNDGYEKLAAADRIRLLFLWAGIPTAIPAELDHLTRLAKAENWPDSPTAMTMIRNTITHPTRKNREKYGKHTHDARFDAWRLGLWYLELCLLRLFEYGGTYASRITQRWTGQVESVPWVTEAAK